MSILFLLAFREICVTIFLDSTDNLIILKSMKKNTNRKIKDFR